MTCPVGLGEKEARRAHTAQARPAGYRGSTSTRQSGVHLHETAEQMTQGPHRQNQTQANSEKKIDG